MDRRALKKRNNMPVNVPNTVCIKCKNYTPNEAKIPTCLATPLQPYQHRITGEVLYPDNRIFEWCKLVNTAGNCPKYIAKE